MKHNAALRVQPPFQSIVVLYLAVYITRLPVLYAPRPGAPAWSLSSFLVAFTYPISITSQDPSRSRPSHPHHPTLTSIAQGGIRPWLDSAVQGHSRGREQRQAGLSKLAHQPSSSSSSRLALSVSRLFNNQQSTPTSRCLVPSPPPPCSCQSQSKRAQKGNNTRHRWTTAATLASQGDRFSGSPLPRALPR